MQVTKFVTMGPGGICYNDKIMYRVGIVVQRYGLEINGGAEYHARLIAERIRSDVAVEVFTTTAINYVTWAHHYPEGSCEINGIPVHRFRVERERDPRRFGEIQSLVFEREHRMEDESAWLEEEGPLVPDLLETLAARQHEFDWFVFFSYRYYHSWHGVNRFRDKAILVPTAEHDPVLYLRMFRDTFRLPGAIVYNSPEEKSLINRVSDNGNVPGLVVGVGSEIPQHFDVRGFRDRHDIHAPYAVYIGRLDENKGVPELLDFYTSMDREQQPECHLVLIGKAWIPVPEHPRIHYLGFMPDHEKFNALKGSLFLINPSQFESLSMVTLESWALEKPAMVNGRTEVLRGQCIRSNAGLWYTDYAEFVAVWKRLSLDESLRARLGSNGAGFFQRHYSWPVIRGKYKKIFATLAAGQNASSVSGVSV